MQLFNLFIKLIFDALKDIKKALLKILKDLWAIIQYAFNKIKEFEEEYEREKKLKENNKNNDLIGMHLLDGNLQQKAN